MRTVPFDDVDVVGMLDRDVTPDGFVVRRLPAWTRPQITDMMLGAMLTMPAGVRLAFRSDARRIELDGHVTRIEMKGRDVVLPVFDLVVDGEVVTGEPVSEGTVVVVDSATGDLDFRPGGPTTVTFELQSSGTRDVEIWLPHGATVELRALRVDDGASVSPTPSTRPRWIHHGSSISHCMEALRPTETWPAIAARLAGLDLLNLAFAGQCQLDQFTARTIRDQPADLISLKIGINLINADSMRERTFRPALHGFLDTIREGHPTTPILLLTPIACPIVETTPGPTRADEHGKFVADDRPSQLAEGALTLQLIRAIEAEIVETRRSLGDANLHLVDGLSLFGPDDVADLDDDLHPNPDGYRRMGTRFHEHVLGRKPWTAT